jgi:hypothetical protein
MRSLIHINVNEFSKHLEKEIESLTATFTLEESAEDSGLRDHLWEVNTSEEAVSAGEELQHLFTNRNLIKIKVKANYHPEIQPISYKA